MSNITTDIPIIYEDNHILVVFKPEGILSQKAHPEDLDLQYYLKEYLKQKYNKPGNVYLGLIHRLDQRTSGVMVLAKTSKAASRLSDQMRSHQIKKKYYAICLGFFEGTKTLTNTIKKDDGVARITKEEGKEAILTYQVIKNISIEKQMFTICDVELFSGRYNQIRAQFAHINHPLFNDYKYSYRLNILNNEQLGLCCYKIGFYHPISKEYLEFSTHPKGGIWNYL